MLQRFGTGPYKAGVASFNTVIDASVQPGKPSSALFVLVSILHTVKHLPIRIRAIFGIQFFAWLGWFNMLFYSSTWYLFSNAQ